MSPWGLQTLVSAVFRPSNHSHCRDCDATAEQHKQLAKKAVFFFPVAACPLVVSTTLWLSYRHPLHTMSACSLGLHAIVVVSARAADTHLFCGEDKEQPTERLLKPDQSFHSSRFVKFPEWELQRSWRDLSCFCDRTFVTKARPVEEIQTHWQYCCSCLWSITINGTFHTAFSVLACKSCEWFVVSLWCWLLEFWPHRTELVPSSESQSSSPYWTNAIQRNERDRTE